MGLARHLKGESRLAGFALGFGALVWAYSDTSFPPDVRSPGSRAMLTSALAATVIVGLVTLEMLTAWGGSGTSMFFGAMAVLTLAFLTKLAPATTWTEVDASPAVTVAPEA